MKELATKKVSVTLDDSALNIAFHIICLSMFISGYSFSKVKREPDANRMQILAQPIDLKKKNLFRVRAVHENFKNKMKTVRCFRCETN